MAVKTNFEVNGKNYFRTSISIGRDSNGKPIRKTFYGKSQKEAEKKKNEYLDGIKQGLNMDTKNLYVASVMKDWLFDIIKISSKIKPSTFDRYEGVFRLYIEKSEIGISNLTTLKPLQIQKYYNKLKEEGKSSIQIATINKVLKRFMFYAVDEGYILKNPCIRLVIPRDIETKKDEVEIFSDRDLNSIVFADEDTMIKSVSLLCLATGMRRGEALGLRFEDIDEVGKEIHIRRSVKTVTEIERDGTRKVITIAQTTKTLGSVRDIPLTDELKPILKSLKVTNAENELKAGQSYFKENKGYIFLTEQGKLIDASNFSRAWSRFLKRNKIKHKKFHALRHTYATKQFEAGIHIITVSKLLGHANSNITESTYTHVLKKEKEKSVNILSVIKM